MSCCVPSCCAETSGQSARSAELPVAIIGAGPVGLAAAAYLQARGIDPIILESGADVGTAPRAWGHVRMFSPWRYNIDSASRALLQEQGWQEPDAEVFPSGQNLADQYLSPLARTPAIAATLQLNKRVTAITRAGLGKVRDAARDEAPFEIRVEDEHGREGRIFARAVIDASGTGGTPSPAGASGLPAIGEREAARRIHYGMPDVLGADRERYAGKRVLVIGTGHSAIGTVIDLCALALTAQGTEVFWASRTGDLARAYGGGSADQFPERGALGYHLKQLVAAEAVKALAPFAVDGFQLDANGALKVTSGDGQAVTVDQAIVATGLRPDLRILGELRLDLDPALECPAALGPLIDPNLHSCGTVRPHGAMELAQPETGVFIAGIKSYGRAPTFLLATGYEQVRSIAAYLAGDLEAARRVELDLPETGVCSSNFEPAGTTSCCAPAEATLDVETLTVVSSCCAPVGQKVVVPA